MKHKNFLYVLFSLTGLLMFVCGYAYEVDRYNSLKFGAFNPTGGQTYYLQSSISSTQTTITLSSFEEPSSNIPYTMSYLNSTIEYATINPQGSPKEFVSFTGITQNSDGSATLTGVLRGLEFSYPYQASTTLAQPFAGQTRFILSNPPQLYTSYAALANNNVLYGINTFSSTSPPRLDEPGAQASGSYIATTSEFATVLYVNNVALSGAPNASVSVKGLVQLATSRQEASSTNLGSTGASLALSSQYATDTPGTLCSTNVSCTVKALMNGKISQAWLDLTQAFTVTGAWLFTNTVAVTATSTLATTTINGINDQPWFGGNGSAGALAISSGTTTITVPANVQYVEKDYTSISITGTASLQFSSSTNAVAATGVVIILRSQGNCTITSTSNASIDGRWLGGGSGSATALSDSPSSGQSGIGGSGGGSTKGFGLTTPFAGAEFNIGGTQEPPLQPFEMPLPGGNGSVGGTGGPNGFSFGPAGTGGIGGAAVYLECGGIYTFTGSINVAGGTGIPSPNNSSGGEQGGDGGGGGGGNVEVLANKIGTDSGAYTLTAGAGGSGNGSSGNAGAAGSHLEVTNIYR